MKLQKRVCLNINDSAQRTQRSLNHSRPQLDLRDQSIVCSGSLAAQHTAPFPPAFDSDAMRPLSSPRDLKSEPEGR
jgi:hypothetical protein